MTPTLSANSQAILLLTAPLIAGRNDASDDLLSAGEYNRLARALRDHQRQPSDLLGAEMPGILGAAGGNLDLARLKRLLGRGFLLSQALEHWRARSIWVMSRADPTYPGKWKARLKEEAPPILYGCGEVGLLESGGLAVVGSREVNDELLTYTAKIGNLAASSGQTLVSGGARGVDQAAMRGALTAGGAVVGVLADSLEKAVLVRDHREALMEQQLTLISPYDPVAGFNVGHAMQRNKLIYALADAALVVNSDFNKGGTWAGAVEQIEKYHCGPIFVRTGAHLGKGNDALIRKGALPWPEPKDPTALKDVLARGLEMLVHEQQETLSLAVEEAPPKTDA